jgi:hypothetical protein
MKTKSLKILAENNDLLIYRAVEIKLDPFFDGLRDEPEFQQSVREWVLKYEAEHERVRQWLDGNDML